MDTTAVIILAVGLGSFMFGLILCLPIAFHNEMLKRQINNRPKTRFEDIDWTHVNTCRFEDIRDLLRECIRSGKYNASVIESDLDWLYEVVKQASEIKQYKEQH